MKRKVIYIPDDNRPYILLMAIQLRKMGFAVKSFLAVSDMLASMKQTPPDMIFIDEGITGAECQSVIKELKQSDNPVEVPVVVISNDPDESRRDKCLAMGAESYLMMPVSIRELHEILQRCLYIPFGYHRNYLRVCFAGRVMVSHDGIGEWLQSVTLSEKGIYVRKKYPYPVGSGVIVSVPLLEEKAISIEGRVIYINEYSPESTDEPSGMAIEFSYENMDNLIVVTNYVEGLLTIPTVVSINGSIACDTC